MKFCPWCGKVLINQDAVFCEHCGRRIRPQEGPGQTPPAAAPSAGPGGESTIPPEAPKAPEQPEAALRPVRHLEFEEEPEEYIPPEEEWAPREEPDEPPVIDVRYRDASGGDKPRRVKKSAGRSFALPMIYILAVAAAAAGAVGLWLNTRTAPQKAAAQFVRAVEARDVSYIREHLQDQNTYEVTDQGLELMCRSAEAEKLLQALESHLLAQGVSSQEGYLPGLDSFVMEESRSGLRREYEFAIRPVLVQVETGLPEVTLTVDGQSARYTSNSDGAVSLRLLPGTHTVEASFDGYGPSYSLGGESFTSFSSSEGVTLRLGEDAASVSIELAGNETGLSVKLNGSESGIQPEAGRVTITPAFEGMEIALSCDQYAERFSVGAGKEQSFEVGWIHETEKKNPGPTSLAPADITNRQLAAAGSQLFYRFYLSYLEAINLWDESLITGVSAGYKDELLQKMEANNKDYLFDFKWMEIDKDTVDRYTEEGKTYAEFGAEVYYEYSYKEDQSMWYAGGNFQWVTLLYNETSRRWEVAGTRVYDSMELGSHRIRYEAEAE